MFVADETGVAGSYASLMTGGVRLTLAGVALGVALTGCSDSTDTTRLWIGPERVECEGVARLMCLQVAESEDGDYRCSMTPSRVSTIKRGRRT